MAYLIRKKTSKHWHARFRDAGGRWVEASTGTADRDAALSVALEYERAATALDIRKAAAKAMRRIAGIAAEHARKPVSCREWRRTWLERKRRLAPSTIHAYRAATALLDSLGDAPLDALTPEQIAGWAHALPCAANTTNRKIKILRMCLRDSPLDHNPAEKVRPVGGRADASGERRAFTREEIAAVLAVAPQPWRGLILAGLYTGQRLGDLAGLTRESVRGNTILVVARKTGGRSLLLPLAPPLKRWIDAHAGPVALFAPLHRRARPGLSNKFAALLQRAGLRPKQRHRQHHGLGREAARKRHPLTFHSLRHTAVSWLRLAGAPLAVSQAIAGHKSKAVHDAYTHVSPMDAAPWVEGMPDVTAQGER